MIDNIKLIEPLLNFDTKGDFYMLYIFKRKKDQPEGEKENSQSVRTIKTYCIDSLEYLYTRYEEIQHLCEYFKARAYIHVQKQNHKDVGLNMMCELATRLKDGAINQKNLFDSVVGQLKTYEKRWIIDIDFKNEDYLEIVEEAINSCEPVGEKIIEYIPTKNGFHIITKPFNTYQFRDKGYNDDIQKKNPTLLFLPNSLQ